MTGNLHLDPATVLATPEFDRAQYDVTWKPEAREGFAKCYQVLRAGELIGYVVLQEHVSDCWTCLDAEGGFLFPSHVPMRTSRGRGVTEITAAGWKSRKVATFTLCDMQPLAKTEA